VSAPPIVQSWSVAVQEMIQRDIAHLSQLEAFVTDRVNFDVDESALVYLFLNYNSSLTYFMMNVQCALICRMQTQSQRLFYCTVTLNHYRIYQAIQDQRIPC
jgi:hypothetical protein